MTYKIKPTTDNFKTHMLFPTVVATVDNTSIPRQDHELVLNSEYVVQSKYGAFPTTKNKRILDTVPSIKAWIQLQLDKYARDIMGSEKLQFTQSWAIKHENIPQSIFTHSHANSIISGSYYIDAPTGSEALTFIKPSYVGGGPVVEYEKDFQNKPWLYDEIKFGANTGRLILFPSNLQHAVMGYQTMRQRRCVLAFNTWFAGPIGTEEGLTRLEL
jgi:uncharacterized protein (TIGR02466 family)